MTVKRHTVSFYTARVSKFQSKSVTFTCCGDTNWTSAACSNLLRINRTDASKHPRQRLLRIPHGRGFTGSVTFLKLQNNMRSFWNTCPSSCLFYFTSQHLGSSYRVTKANKKNKKGKVLKFSIFIIFRDRKPDVVFAVFVHLFHGFYFCHLQSGDKGLKWTKSLQLHHPPHPDRVPQKKHTPHCKPPPTYFPFFLEAHTATHSRLFKTKQNTFCYFGGVGDGLAIERCERAGTLTPLKLLQTERLHKGGNSQKLLLVRRKKKNTFLFSWF